MATDGDTAPDADEMLADEQEVLPERGDALNEIDEDELLTVDELAESLDIDIE